MALWKDGEFMTDVWLRADDHQPLPDTGFAIMSLDRWTKQHERLLASGRPLGLWLSVSDDLSAVCEDLRHFALVALEYPSFTDGRAYSAARLIRERFGYSGELRAVGDVLIDQMPLMRRVGFNTFNVENEAAIAQLRSGHLPDISLYLQPANGHHEIPAGTRPWARRSAD